MVDTSSTEGPTTVETTPTSSAYAEEGGASSTAAKESTSETSTTSPDDLTIDPSLSDTVNKTTRFDMDNLTITGEIGIEINPRTLTYVGNDGAVKFRVITQLPNGLTLDKSKGIISGTPTIAGSSTISIIGTDTKGNEGRAEIVFNLFSKMEVPLPKNGIPVQTGDNVAFLVQVLGGSGTYRFTLDTDHFPNLYIDPVSGGISGVFQKPGTYNVPVQIYDGFDRISIEVPFIVSGVVVNEAMFRKGANETTMAELGIKSLDNYIEILSRPVPDYPSATLCFYDVCCKLCYDPSGEFLDKLRLAMIDYGSSLLMEQTYLRGALGLLSKDQRLFVSTIYSYWRAIFYYRRTPDVLDWNEFLRISRSQTQLQYLIRFGNLNR